MHSRNPEIIKYAEMIGRTPSALAMKLTNIASLDPAITETGRKGLDGASFADKAMWQEMQSNWESFAIEAQQAAAVFGVVSESDDDIDVMTLPERRLPREERGGAGVGGKERWALSVPDGCEREWCRFGYDGTDRESYWERLSFDVCRKNMCGILPSDAGINGCE